MCGRFSVGATATNLAAQFDLFETPAWSARYNTAPTREVLVVVHDSPGRKKKYPRLQIITVAELLEGKGVNCPPSRHGNITFKKAPKAAGRDAKALSLPFGEEE